MSIGFDSKHLLRVGFNSMHNELYSLHSLMLKTITTGDAKRKIEEKTP